MQPQFPLQFFFLLFSLQKKILYNDNKYEQEDHYSFFSTLLLPHIVQKRERKNGIKLLVLCYRFIVIMTNDQHKKLFLLLLYFNVSTKFSFAILSSIIPHSCASTLNMHNYNAQHSPTNLSLHLKATHSMSYNFLYSNTTTAHSGFVVLLLLYNMHFIAK